MQRHDDIEHPLLALLFLGTALHLAVVAFAAAVGARCQVPGQNAGEGRENGAKCADDRVGHGHQLRRRRGSSASRRPSPMRLMASTVMRMARPGKAMTQGCDIIRSRVSASMAPHSGVGG